MQPIDPANEVESAAQAPQSGATLPSPGKELPLLAMAALGIIYGDIGTSPLYTIKECFTGAHGVTPTAANVLGIMSLVFWSLMLVVGLKYVVFIMRADNKGEGGIFSLLSMLQGLQMSGKQWSLLMFLAAFGAALLYGDGVITPAISVLSAIEGLNMATDAAAKYVVPLTCLVLVILFVVQRHGTARIGTLFGPIMVVWFLVLGGLGVGAIAGNQEILAALDPRQAISFFLRNGLHGFVVLGGVVLCITGGEALYADMGHFGRLPIRLSWYGAVLPGLVLNYFGQGALLLHHPELVEVNPFYALVPQSLLYPMVGLSTMATIIASQAMISGVYSLTQQAIQLGFTPRMHIVHTSEQTKGQIYMPTVNWMLMIACLSLVLAFKESTRLAAAYGIAVTATMAITSFIYFKVTSIRWQWPWWQSASLLALFLFFDCSFLGANLLKITDGGWITLCIAVSILIAMMTWRDGRAILAKHYSLMKIPTEVFLKDIAGYKPQRISGTAVFMSISPEGIPHTLLHHFKHNEALHERILLLSILAAETPTVALEDRVSIEDLGLGFYRIKARYGFMETPALPEIIELLSDKGMPVDIYSTSFYLGRENMSATGTAPMAHWRKLLFIYMSRNAWNATSFFKLPPDRVVELGNHVEL
ncbi:KUP/HAK/KT family potassium transporter [uncultured Desulfobulbus sp.]|uniref:potassium transporter Kup n=1 Tax=uncultured Desulfobulbus sp. TaxID=239745 RepID=UPI0029C9A902|nr:KUP/HAK/KT family potassium transporter [uncultured Desulfobulbus sp.]